MNVFLFTFVVCVMSMLAGFLGALTGLGGGLVIVPCLVLLLGVDIRYAIGASVVSVIATSSGAAAAYVQEGYSNVRIGMLLEIATTLGAISGAMLATRVPVSGLAIVFGGVLVVSAYLSGPKKVGAWKLLRPDPLATALRLDSSFPTANGHAEYHVQHVPAGFGLMYVAGVLSGMLGIGSGALKVIAMDQAMGLPFKVSTTTSNFMIGVTAAASAGIYLRRGYIDPGLAMPVIIGVLVGSIAGARVLAGAQSLWLRRVFMVVIVILAVEMVYEGVKGGL
jgi:uncharacterized protein